MGIGLTQIKHVKLPVADLRRSASWYRALLDLELVAEYVEDGAVRGVVLCDRDGGFEIALRQREYCPGDLRFAGFDVFALRAPTRDMLATVAERCDRLGIGRTEVLIRPGYGGGLDIPDPDGVLVRVVWHDPAIETGFRGMAVGADGQPQLYGRPRLHLDDLPG